MIKVSNREDDLKLMKIYYDNGLCWIYADTFEKYREKSEKQQWRDYYVWDMESLKDYIRLNDTYCMTVDMYLRERKLERILNDRP